MTPKVSVVIPVWNPGPNLQRCLGSLIDQTMPRSDYEIICVDDGSTDGSAERLDAWADRHPSLIRVIHTPNSGWPGRPRNVGIDAARAPYVHLVDNDDALPPYALAALHAAAVASDADIVLGRPVSDFRGLNHSIYRRDIVAGTLAAHPELAETLTPHKMFRRELLQRFAIRFPEGPVPLEDQFFVLKAYLHARAITLLTDRPYYAYLRRTGSGRNAGDREVDPTVLCRSVAELLSIVESGTDDADLRTRLFRRAYRVVLLPRLSGRLFLDADEGTRRDVVQAVREMIVTRFGPAVRDGCGAAHRSLGRTVLDGDLAAVDALAGELSHVSLRVSATSAHWSGGALRLRLGGVLHRRGAPMVCERVLRTDDPDAACGAKPDGDGQAARDASPAGEAGGWALPAALAPGVPVRDRLLGRAADPPDVELSLVSRTSHVSYGITDGIEVVVDGAGVVQICGTVDIDPETFAAGSGLDDGLWDLRIRLRFEGWHKIAKVHIARGLLPPPLLRSGEPVVVPFRADHSGALAIDVGQWTHPVDKHVAPTAMLAADAAGGLELTVRADVAPVRGIGRVGSAAVTGRICDAEGASAAPVATVLLDPEPGAPPGLLRLSGDLRSFGHAARAHLSFPESGPAADRVAARDGSWRAWLVISAPADPVAEIPARMRWRVHRSGGRLSVERVADGVNSSRDHPNPR